MKLISTQAAKPLVVMLVALMLFPFAFSGCQAQSATDVYTEKLVSFLSEVLGLDMVQCTITSQGVTDSGSERNFVLNYKHLSAFIVVDFYNNSIALCNIYSHYDLPYKQLSPDRYNTTLEFLQRYQIWTDDDSVANMVTLLQTAGLEKDTIKVSDDLELTISVKDFEVKYGFYNFYNGVEYTGVSLTYVLGSGDILFRDSRVNQQIGNTTINLSEEQAVTISTEYVQNFTYNINSWNSSNFSKTGFNVSGVYAVYLESAPISSSVRLPYWHVWLNVSDPIQPNQQGFELYLSAKDGTVPQIKTFQLPKGYTLPPITDYQSPIMLLIVVLLFTLIGGLVAVLIVLIVMFKVTRPNPVSTPRRNSKSV